MTIQAKATVWNGTASEQDELLSAVQHNCACVYTGGARSSICASHRVLVEDQRFLDGVLFMRRMAARLRYEERSLIESAARHDEVNCAQPEPTTFTPDELRRLTSCRAAAAAGFYTEFFDEEAESNKDRNE